MAITEDFGDTLKEEKEKLHTSISQLEKMMADYKEEKKTDWQSFKKKYKEDFAKIKKAIKKLKEPKKDKKGLKSKKKK